MVGRRGELARLRAELAASARGVRTVVVSGQPGIGKTGLVRAFLDGCDLPRHFVAAARRPAPPLALVRDAVAHVPEVDLGGTPTSAVAAAHRLTGSGAVWWFDDLQLADLDSLRFVAALSRAATLPALVVACLRTDVGPPEGASPVAALRRSAHTTELALGPLGLGATRELVAARTGRPPAPREVAALHHRSGGNPWLLDQLVRAGAAAGGDRPLPPAVRAALRVWLPPLATGVLEVVQALAVLRHGATFELLCAVVGADGGAVESALAEAALAGVVVEVATDRFAVTGPLVREAVLGTLLSRRRRRLHGRALAALASSTEVHHGVIVEHALGARRRDLLADHAAPAVLERLRAGDPIDAVLLADRVVAAGVDTPDVRRSAVEAALAAGFVADVRAHACRLGAMAREQGRLSDEAWVERQLAAAARVEGDHDGERAHLDAALRLAARAEAPGEVARSRAAAARAAATTGRVADALRSGHAALAFAEAAGADDAVPQALVGIGLAHDRAGRPDAALHALRRARRVASEQAQTACELAVVDEQLRLLVRDAPPDEAEALVREALDLSAGRHGPWPGLWQLALARLRLRQGDLDAAVTLGEEALDALVGHPRAELAARAGLAELRYERGDVDAGRAVLEPVLDRVDTEADPALAVASRASAALLAGAARDTTEQWRHAGALVDLARAMPAADGAPARVLVDLAAPAGDPERVRHLWHRLGPRGRRLGDAAWPDHVTAVLAEAAGDHEAAAAAYGRSVAADEGRRGRLCLAAAHTGLARTLGRAGRADDARRHARRAVGLLERAAGWRREEALRLHGLTPATEHAQLSPRECQVAALVAAGLSNPEVAERLYIAPKTASAHVSHILTKLGFRSRAEVAAWAAIEGLVALGADGILSPTDGDGAPSPR